MRNHQSLLSNYEGLIDQIRSDTLAKHNFDVGKELLCMAESSLRKCTTLELI